MESKTKAFKKDQMDTLENSILCSFLRGLMFICEMPKRTRGLGLLFLRFFKYDDPPIN